MSKNLNFAANVLNYRGPKWFKDFLGKRSLLQKSGHQKPKRTGHGELLELRLLEKSARHDFIIAQHRSSNNIFSCQLLESS